LERRLIAPTCNMAAATVVPAHTSALMPLMVIVKSEVNGYPLSENSSDAGLIHDLKATE
jgi:hypothetical protein